MLILYLVQQDKLGGSHMAGGYVWGMCPALSGKKDAMVNKEYCYSICNILYVHIPVAVCASVTKCCSSYINILTVIDTLIFVVRSVRVEYQIHSSELVLLVICPEPKHNQLYRPRLYDMGEWSAMNVWHFAHA